VARAGLPMIDAKGRPGSRRAIIGFPHPKATGGISFNVRKVLWLCDEIGLPFEREDYGRGFRPTSTPEFLKLNPVGQVPCVIDDRFICHNAPCASPSTPRARPIVAPRRCLPARIRPQTLAS
jgi:hypothetical protein